MKALTLFSMLLGMMTLSLSALAFDHDPETLKLKGFSPDLIKPLQVQIDRQEGRMPPNATTKCRQLWYNALNNEWANSLEAFGSDKIDESRYPRPEDPTRCQHFLR